MTTYAALPMSKDRRALVQARRLIQKQMRHIEVLEQRVAAADRQVYGNDAMHLLRAVRHLEAQKGGTAEACDALADLFACADRLA